jgi:hypothetical protein
MRQRRFSFRPLLEAFEDRLCPSSTVVLPISAFLAQQGHDMVFTPPVRDQLSWSNSTFDPGTGIATRDLLVDYTGQAAQYLLQHGINLHTTVTGFVTETTVGTSGLMEVTVNLEARNALTWVANVAGINPNEPGVLNAAPIEFGYRAQELVANPHLTPALSDVHFQMTWQEDVGADLPDLSRVLSENFDLYAPPGFALERVDVQSQGTGTLRADTTAGTPGQTAIASTWQVADLTDRGQALPGTLPDGFWQEPIDVIPIASPSAHVAYLNGTLFVIDTSDSNDSVSVTPAANGGATVRSNLGNGTFAHVTRVVVALGGGNNDVDIEDLPGATVNVVTFNGNNHIDLEDAARLVVHVGCGNNHISTENTSPAAQFIFVGGSGNNQIDVDSSNAAEILVAGNGNNHISAGGAGDFLEVLGNGNNHIADTGTNDLVWLGGDGNNDVDNQGDGSFTDILAGTGHNHIRGRWGFEP